MTLVYLAPVAWDSYQQRPHYFIRHFLKRPGCRAVWVNPYPTRLPTLRDVQQLVNARPLISSARPDGLSVIRARALPLEPFAAGRWLNHRLFWNEFVQRLNSLVGEGPLAIGVARPSSIAFAALQTFRPARSFYDALDDYPEFYQGFAKTSTTLAERAITETVDVVITASSALWRKFTALGRRRLMVHNAFEMSELPPLPIARDGRQVFGYVGCVGDWFDWPSTIRLADAFRSGAVHVVGPCFQRPVAPLPENLKLFPACSAQRAIEYFASFSVGIIPFKRTPLTEAVDPVKSYGYRGMDLPVLSTTFGEMSRRGASDGTFLVDGSGTGLKDAAAAALSAKFDQGVISKFRQDHTWQRRFEEAEVFGRLLD